MSQTSVQLIYDYEGLRKCPMRLRKRPTSKRPTIVDQLGMPFQGHLLLSTESIIFLFRMLASPLFPHLFGIPGGNPKPSLHASRQKMDELGFGSTSFPSRLGKPAVPESARPQLIEFPKPSGKTCLFLSQPNPSPSSFPQAVWKKTLFTSESASQTPAHPVSLNPSGKTFVSQKSAEAHLI